MGLNFGYKLKNSEDLDYYSDFKWSYSGFNLFRKRLANEGFTIGANEEGYKKLSNYLKDNINEIEKDCE